MSGRAVVLARGLGKRMRREGPAALDADKEAAASRGLKALMPLRGRPFIDYAADSLLRAGLRSICLVIAPDADALRDQARRISAATGAEVTWAVQQEPRGTADAVLAAEAFVAGEPFVLANGDDLYPQEALGEMAGKQGPDCWLAAFERDEMVRQGNVGPERVRDFAVVAAGPDGRLLNVVEKPTDPERYAQDGRVWVSMNLYRFTADVFDACRRVRPHPERGELELTAAVADLLERGRPRFRVAFCRGGVLDLTSRGDVLSAECALAGRDLSF